MRAAIYVRLSSYRGASDPTTSPERQEEACRAYATARGWEVVAVFRDLDVSGSAKGDRLDRRGLQDVRAMFGSIEALIVAKVDRLARDTADFLAFAAECEANGVGLVSVAEALDMTTPGGKFTATILAAFAQMEAQTIAERTAAGRAGTVAAGRYPGGRVPYGYRTAPHPSGAGRCLVPVPEEAAHICNAAAHVLSGGSLHGAVRLLNDAGSVPRTARNWSSASLRVVLRSPALLGQQQYQGRPVLADDGTPAQLWEPIIDADTHRRLVALLAPTPTRRRPRADYLLSGLLTCVSCGRTMHATTRSTRATYRCPAEGGACPSSVEVQRERAEAEVVGAFIDRYGDEAVYYVIRETAKEHAHRLAAVETGLRVAAEAMTAPGADMPALIERINALRSERDALAASGPSTAERRVPAGMTLADLFAERDDTPGGIRECRERLSERLESAVVHPADRRGGPRIALKWTDE